MPRIPNRDCCPIWYSMAVTHKSTRRSAVSSEGSEAPKRKTRQRPKAVSAEPAVEASSPSKPGNFEISPPSKPEVVEIAPPTVDAIRIPPLMASSSQVLGHAKENPVTKSSAPIVEPAHSPVAAANSEPEYLKSLTRERVVWAVVVAVSWTITLVALLRLGII